MTQGGLFRLVVADKSYISQKDEILAYVRGGVRPIPRDRRNMHGNSAEDTAFRHLSPAD